MATCWLRDFVLSLKRSMLMFTFKLEPEIPLLSVKRKGSWSLATVAAYEIALRRELVLLLVSGRPRSFIIDVRLAAPTDREVTAALRSVTSRLCNLKPERMAVVASFGIAKLQAKRMGKADAQVFTTMVLARDWATAVAKTVQSPGTVYDEPSVANPEGASVHVQGPSDVDIVLTPAAALETAKRIHDAAIDILTPAVVAE